MKFAYRQKKFLAPASPGDLSAILLEAEDSENGQKKSGQYTIAITDNHNRVNLDFYLGTARHRKQAWKKLDTLMTQIIRFGSVLVKQSEAIERASNPHAPTKKSPAKKKSRKQKGKNLGNAS